MKKILFLAAAIIFLSSNCKKNKHTIPADNPYGLPNPTQTGANIFAFRVNEQNWISEKEMYVINAGFRDDTLFAFGTTGNDNYFEMMSVEINGNTIEGQTYNVNDQYQSCSFRLSTNKTCSGLIQGNHP